MPLPCQALTQPQTEHDNLSGDPAMAGQLDKMRRRLAELEASYYKPDRGHDDGTAKRVAITRWGGFWGPFVFP